MTSRPPSLRARVGLGLVTLGVLAAIALDDSGGLKEPVRILTALPFGDKIGHFTAFGLLAFFVARVFPAPRLRFTAGRVPLSVALVFVLTALEELSQAWIPWRHCDIFDLCADAAGMTLFTWLALNVRTKTLAVREALAASSE